VVLSDIADGFCKTLGAPPAYELIGSPTVGGEGPNGTFTLDLDPTVPNPCRWTKTVAVTTGSIRKYNAADCGGGGNLGTNGIASYHLELTMSPSGVMTLHTWYVDDGTNWGPETFTVFFKTGSGLTCAEVVPLTNFYTIDGGDTLWYSGTATITPP